MRTIQADRQPLSATDPRDDWLSDANDLDWFQGEAGERRDTRPGLGRGRGTRRPRAAGPPGERSLQQRRLVAVGVLAAIVVVAIVVIVMASGSGKKAVTPPVASTPAVTTQATGTTTTGVKTPTTPHSGTTALTLTLPKGTALKSGDKTALVKKLQLALTKLGATGLKADGSFGAKTQDAVTAFQTQHKLTADGVVGAKTAQAIDTALAQLG